MHLSSLPLSREFAYDMNNFWIALKHLSFIYQQAKYIFIS